MSIINNPIIRIKMAAMSGKGLKLSAEEAQEVYRHLHKVASGLENKWADDSVPVLEDDAEEAMARG